MKQTARKDNCKYNKSIIIATQQKMDWYTLISNRRGYPWISIREIGDDLEMR